MQCKRFLTIFSRGLSAAPEIVAVQRVVQQSRQSRVAMMVRRGVAAGVLCRAGRRPQLRTGAGSARRVIAGSAAKACRPMNVSR